MVIGTHLVKNSFSTKVATVFLLQKGNFWAFVGTATPAVLKVLGFRCELPHLISLFVLRQIEPSLGVIEVRQGEPAVNGGVVTTDADGGQHC